MDELLARFDVTDPEFLADPYPVLGALREAAPGFRDPTTGRWTLTRFDEISAALRDRRLGRAHTHRYTHAELGLPEPDPRWVHFHRHERWSLLALEPPDHTRLRRLVSKVFSPRAVAAARPSIEALADEVLDECVERGRFDLIADLAQPFSVAVICSLLGVPRDEAGRLLDWSHAIVRMYELHVPDEVAEAADRAAGEFLGFTHDLIAERRRRPDGGLVSRLAEVADGEERLTDDEIACTTMVLLEAGHEATVNTLGNGVRALLDHPDQWRRLVDGEVPASVAVEELLRFDPPLQLFDRWVLEDGVELAGQPLEVGDRVNLLFGAAQRDPRRFDAPDAFDVGRGDTAHLGFGGGIHFCLGAPLAREELAVSLAGLVRRAPELSLAAEPRHLPNFVIRGLEALEVDAGGPG